jgi:hypothetical protein
MAGEPYTAEAGNRERIPVSSHARAAGRPLPHFALKQVGRLRCLSGNVLCEVT